MNAGIIGVGNLGSIHLRILRGIKSVKKIYLVDIDPGKLHAYPEDKLSDYRQLNGKVDFVIVAVPTSLHYPISRFFLEHKIPVLVEKPLTNRLNEAKSLIHLAKKHHTLLEVGHVERYNNALISSKKFIKSPRFIECHRLSPYPWRSLDIGVVLDLMIHDLDIILDIVKDKVKKIEAVGVNVLSGYEDIANARLTFSKGCIANITASRISHERLRKFRVFSQNSYLSLDYANQKVDIYRKESNRIEKKSLDIKKGESLKNEDSEFVQSVKRKMFSLSSCNKAMDALALALKIQKIIAKSTS
ncbi:MAG: Gfo/Idh/MocA family oxidoreductase [Candidatus Omnitrophica bacterium]|nr:Gfo/Idh/MocA family oxidoreductase [Candidatus Omnitrophota bacterium]